VCIKLLPKANVWWDVVYQASPQSKCVVGCMCINLLPRANVWWDVCVSSFSPKQMCGGCACLKIKNKYALLVLPKSLPGASVWWDVCKGSLTSFCIANFSYLYTCFYPCNLKHCFILYTRWAMMRMLLKLLICPPTQWSTGNVRQIKLFLVTYNNSFLHFTCLSPIMCCFPQASFAPRYETNVQTTPA